MDYKYIIAEVKFGQMTRQMPFVFPKEMVHQDVAEHVENICADHLWKMVGVISAGDISLDGVFCSGRSVTCGVKSREDTDNKLFEIYPYGGDIR